MPEAMDHGITVTEIAAMDQPISVSRETTAAFVGRALRGPVNTPVLLTSFADYRRRFGEVCARSSLGPAVKQFFDNGGGRLYVVRVVNNARGAMICLPASGSAVVLRAAEPGATEYVRAAVDYDALGDDADRFNLTLQRVNPSNRLIVDQEFFRRLSYREGDDNFIGDALLTSRLVKLEHPYPAHRPEPTVADDAFRASYLGPTQAGADGNELTDYDLVGSRKDASGLFALEDADDFDLLYLPPRGSGVDVGPTAMLAAELYCRQRGAMLIVDPRNDWTTAKEAAAGIQDLGYASPNMLGYFPRVSDRSDVARACRPAGGAIAGLLSRHDRVAGPWRPLDQQSAAIHGDFRPAMDTDAEDRQLLQRAGLNTLLEGPARRARLSGSVTMGRGLEAHREFTSLSTRRFCLRLVSTIAKAIRWAVFESNDASLEQRVRAQVLTYFSALDELGAFADQDFFVHCVAGGSRVDSVDRGLSVLLVFRPSGSEEAISLVLNVAAGGYRVGSPLFSPADRVFT